jgi:hypothetical protein
MDAGDRIHSRKQFLVEARLFRVIEPDDRWQDSHRQQLIALKPGIHRIKLPQTANQ